MNFTTPLLLFVNAFRFFHIIQKSTVKLWLEIKVQHPLFNVYILFIITTTQKITKATLSKCSRHNLTAVTIKQIIYNG